MARTIDDEMLEEMKELIDNGASVQSISLEYGFSVVAIYRRLREKYGLEAASGRRSILDKMDDPEIQELISDYQLGMPVQEILFKYDIPHTTTLYQMLRIMGIEPRSRTVATIEARKMQLDVACRMYQDGAALNDIQAETGIRQPILHQELYKRGIPLRRRYRRRMWAEGRLVDPDRP